MVRDWSRQPLGDFAEFVNGDRSKNYPSQAERVLAGVPFINAGDLADGYINCDGAEKITEVAFDRLTRGKTRSGDILFCLRGTPGRVGRDSRGGGAIASSLVIIRPKPNIDVDFLYFMLSGPGFQSDCRTLNNGSAQPNVSVRSLSSLVVCVPPIHKQRAIASVLGALDDKIEQNRRTARALEMLARAIFRAWFVDFEPVKAKAAGATSFPSMPQPIFDALPTRLVDSPIGPVPEGWEVTCLAAVFEVNPKRALRKGVVAPYLDMKNMPTAGHAPASWAERAFGSGMRFQNGDTLLARITPCLENGKTAFVDFLADNEIGWGSTEYIVLRPRAPLPPVYAYCLARTPEFRDFAIQNMSGTSGRQRVPATAMDYYHLAVPPENAAVAFESIAEPMFDSIRSGVNESRKLAGMRDYLLPKLLSGKVRVATSTPETNE